MKHKLTIIHSNLLAKGGVAAACFLGECES